MSAERFRLGLVVGKFAPLHFGHEFVIHHAAARCDRLLILSYSQPEFERCDAAARRRWLAARFPDHEAVVLDEWALRAACTRRGLAFEPIPDNGASDATQQRFLAWLLSEVLQRAPDAMFCSEDYGAPCAALLSAALGHPVQAVMVDRARRAVPCRADQRQPDTAGSGGPPRLVGGRSG